MKNKKALILLFTANTISGLATGLTILSIPWYFSTILNKPSVFGIAYASITFITLFWSLYAGTMVDKFSRKKIFLFTTLVSSLIIGTVAIIGFRYELVPEPLVILVFATTFLNFNIHYPNLYAFGQEITERKYYGRINSYIEIQGQSTNAIAGAMAALFLTGNISWIPFDIPKLSLQQILLIDASTYFIAFLIISFIRYEPVTKRLPVAGKAFTRLKNGIRFLRGKVPVLIFGIFSNGVFVVVLTHIFFLLPIYVNNHLEADASAFGLAEVFFAGGAILAGIVIRQIFRFTSTVNSVIINTVASIILLVLMVVTKSVFVLMIASLFLGLSNAGIRIMRMTYLFNHLPNEVIGRTNSVFNFIGTVKRIFFIGIFSLPFFSIGNNIIYAYAVFALFLLISLSLLIRYRKDLVENKP